MTATRNYTIHYDCCICGEDVSEDEAKDWNEDGDKVCQDCLTDSYEDFVEPIDDRDWRDAPRGWEP